MQRIFLTLITAILVLVGTLYYLQRPTSSSEAAKPPEAAADTTPFVVADHLHVPWDIAFLPDQSLLVTERGGALVHISPRTGARVSFSVSSSTPGEGGLLGIVLHPDFEHNHFLYLYESAASGTEQTINRVVRYTFTDDTLRISKTIIDGIPGAANHDGGRLAFGPDGLLYITSGDAMNGSLAQSTSSLAGKILRLTDDGTVPRDNPFANAVFSYGHRNPQGLAWDSDGNLWETEHGPSGEEGRCCHDEINRIEKGDNYGWPIIIGDEKKEGMITPVWNSGNDTWAPASLTYFNGSLYFGGLKGQALYSAALNAGSIAGLTTHLSGVYGRIRAVRFGPDHLFYITTSNTDGRGNPSETDDRIIRIGPATVR